MKKLIVLFLTLALMITIVGCDTKKDETLNTEMNSKIQTENNENKELSDTLIQWMQGGIYYFSYTAEMEYDGEQMTSKGSMVSDGNNMAATTEMTVEGQLVKSRVVAVDGVTWIIDDINKFVMKSPVNMNEVNKEMADFSKIEYIGKGNGTIKGKKLSYEEYEAEGFIVKFYIDNGKVYAIESVGEGAKSLMTIESSSKTIPAGSFEIPSNYTQMR